MRKREETKNIQDVLWLDDQAPTSPDCTGTCESNVLSQGKLFCGTVEIGYTGEDNRPLYGEMLVYITKIEQE